MDIVQPGINNNVCNPDRPPGPTPCASGESMSCTTECIDNTYPGGTCTPFSCQAGSVCTFSDDTGRFQNSCVYDSSSGSWKCTPAASGGLHLVGECDPNSTTHFCPADTWCRDIDACSNGTPGGVTHLCSVFALQGRVCDGDHPSLGACTPCAQGTDCIATNSVQDPYTGICRKDCTTADDCPCDADGTQIHTCQNGYCWECRDEGEFCGDQFACCDANFQLECGADEYCCRSDAEACTGNADCCRGSFCNDAKRCQDCAAVGEACSIPDDCCGNDCVGGVCKENCAAKHGDPCDPADIPPGTNGVCKTDARYVCVDGYDLVCKPGEVANETCNGLDDDCDGIIDDNPTDDGGSCTVHPDECIDRPSFQVSGQKECHNGALDCRAYPDLDFCTTSNQTVGGQSCGYATGTPCTPGAPAECSAGAACTNVGGQYQCEHDGSCGTGQNLYPDCWLPSERETCPL